MKVPPHPSCHWAIRSSYPFRHGQISAISDWITPGSSFLLAEGDPEHSSFPIGVCSSKQWNHWKTHAQLIVALSNAICMKWCNSITVLLNIVTKCNAHYLLFCACIHYCDMWQQNAALNDNHRWLATEWALNKLGHTGHTETYKNVLLTAMAL